MFRIQVTFIKLLEVISVFLYLSHLLYVGLNVIMVTIPLLILLISFYGLYRTKKGQNMTKGITCYIQPIFKMIRKSFKIKCFGLAVFLTISIILVSAFNMLLYIFAYTIVSFMLISVGWGTTKYILKQFKNIDIPSFFMVIRLAF